MRRTGIHMMACASSLAACTAVQPPNAIDAAQSRNAMAPTRRLQLSQCAFKQRQRHRIVTRVAADLSESSTCTDSGRVAGPEGLLPHSQRLLEQSLCRCVVIRGVVRRAKVLEGVEGVPVFGPVELPVGLERFLKQRQRGGVLATFQVQDAQAASAPDSQIHGRRVS